MLKIASGELIYTSADSYEEVRIGTEGVHMIEKKSFEALEEDLHSITNNELPLSPETIKGCVDTGVHQVLDRYAKYINPEVLQKLDLENNPSSTLLQNDILQIGRVKMFVLNSNNFDLFKEAYGTSPTRVESFGSPVAKELKAYMFGREIAQMDIETVGNTYLFIVKSPDEATPKDLRQLESITRHEFMHTLGFGNLFPGYLTEGIVHYYQGEINGKKPSTLSPERQHATEFVYSFVEKMEELGISEDEINGILVGNDKVLFDKAFQTFEKAYGQNTAQKLFSGKFKSAEDADLYIQHLLR